MHMLLYILHTIGDVAVKMCLSSEIPAVKVRYLILGFTGCDLPDWGPPANGHSYEDLDVQARVSATYIIFIKRCQNSKD